MNSPDIMSICRMDNRPIPPAANFSIDSLDSYLSGDVAIRDMAGLEHAPGCNPEILAFLKEVEIARQAPDGSARLQGMWALVESKRGRGILPGKPVGYAGVGKTLRLWVGFGAVTSLIVATSWFFASNYRTIQPETYNTYTTQPGQRASVTLWDGSRVTLGPATTLRVNRTRSQDGSVVVDVIGEALFSVNHAAQRSFAVKAHGVTTRVLGTEFVVRAYDPSQVRVAVREGRVSVQSQVFTSANDAIVAAGEAVSITPNALPSVVPIKDMTTDFAWAEGELVLREVPLGEALVRLSRWYGMDFKVADSSLLKARISANLLSTFSEPDIRTLAEVVGASVTRSGNTVTFSEAK